MKISLLDQLADADIDGTETMPVVKNGKSWRARTSALFAPFVSAARAARDDAQTALADVRAIAATLPWPVYGSTALAQADATLLSGKLYTVVSGAQILIYTKQSPTASTAYGVYPTAGYVDRLKSKVAIPTVDNGAVGSGSSATADQAGFATAVAGIVAGRNGIPTGTLNLFQYQNGLELDPGIYDAGGFTMTDCKSFIKARIPGTVFIRIPDGQYFLTVTGQLMGLYWDGIVFLNGKGAFKATSTAANANQQVRFTNCYFGLYTECAISTNYIDNPFIKIDNCHLGGSGANCGIAIGGYVDQLSIENCAIGGNDYGIALGPRLSGNYNIVRNDLLQNRKADIWLKPNITESGTTNAGWAGAIIYNKFGNETQTAGSPYPRILIANENTAVGTDRATRTPLITLAGDTGKMILPFIAHNRFAHISPWNAPIIRAYVSNLSYGSWEGNQFDGGQATYVIEWPNGRTGDYISNNSDFVFRESDGSVPAQFSTHPFGRLFDYASYWPGDANAVPVYAVSDDPALTLVAAGFSAFDISYASGTTAVAVADPYGTTEYAAVTGLAVLSFTDPYAGAGGMMFVEMALSKAATNALSYVVIDLFNYSGSNYAVKKTVALPANGKPAKVAFPVILPASANPGSWQLRVYGSGIVSGSADTFVVGDMILSKGSGRLGRDRALKRIVPFTQNSDQPAVATSTTLPAGWSINTAVNGMTGIACAVSRVGVDRYGKFVEVTLSGTCTKAGALNIFQAPASVMGLESGNVWRFFTGVRLMSGDFSSATSTTGYDGSVGPVGLSLPCYGTDLVQIAQRGIQITPTTAYKVYGRTLTSAFFNNTADHARPLFSAGFAVGATANAVVRIYTSTVHRVQ